MPKNILIFCDGTGQAGGLLPDETRSNIYKLFRATRGGPDTSIDPALQIAFYDPGLGSRADGSQWWGRLVRGVYNLFAQATGLGITRNIIDCYAYLLRVFEDGDRVYLFGFSRGAYTARCIGGVLRYCGVPTREADGSPLRRGPVSTRALATEAVKQVYQHGSSMRGDPLKAERLRLAVDFRVKYAAGDAGGPNVWPYFIGVFDTVATLGFGKARFWPFVAVCCATLVVAVKMVSWAAGLLIPALRLSWSGSALLVIAAALLAYNIACIRFGGLVSLARYHGAVTSTRMGRPAFLAASKAARVNCFVSAAWAIDTTGRVARARGEAAKQRMSAMGRNIGLISPGVHGAESVGRNTTDRSLFRCEPRRSLRAVTVSAMARAAPQARICEDGTTIANRSASSASAVACTCAAGSAAPPIGSGNARVAQASEAIVTR